MHSDGIGIAIGAKVICHLVYGMIGCIWWVGNLGASYILREIGCKVSILLMSFAY